MEVAHQTMELTNGTELAFATCDCCGLTEECTEDYIKRVRDRYSGRWICGLCAEAVKYEVVRTTDTSIGNEEALDKHMSFCKEFKSLSPKNSSEDLICAVKQLLIRSLDSPRSSPVRKPGLGRTGSCSSALDG